MSDITKAELDHLAKLGRLELTPEEEAKLLADLGKILDHFEELKAVPTDAVKPMTGGTYLKNVFREDGQPMGTNQGEGKDSFPENKRGFLKVPPVFGE